MRKDRGKKHSKKAPHGAGKNKGDPRDRSAGSASNQADTPIQRQNAHSVSKAETPITSGAMCVNPDEMEQQRKFSRRKIESNWDRYEGLPDIDNDNDQNRGRDFMTILNEVGTASTQFRFSDEKDWEEDETETLQATDDVLALDLNSLASDLTKIPLHKRLQIEVDVFPPGVIEKFEKEASQQPGSSEQVDTHPITKPNTGFHTSSEVKGQTNPVASTLKELDKPQTPQLSEEKRELLMSEIGKSRQCESTTEGSKVKQFEQTTLMDNDDDGNDDDELDLLLSLENPVESQMASMQDSEIIELTEKETKNDINKEDKENVAADIHKPPTSVDTSECLEDWLDSMLDD